MFDMFDSDSNGLLSRDEATAGFALLGHPDDVDATSEAMFNLWPSEDEETIDADDLALFVKGLLRFRRGQFPNAPSMDELRVLAMHEATLIMRQGDTSGDGFLDGEEFKKFWPRFAVSAETKPDAAKTLSTFALPTPSVMRKILDINEDEIPDLIHTMQKHLSGDGVVDAISRDDFIDHVIDFVGLAEGDDDETAYKRASVEALLAHIFEVFDHNHNGVLTLKEATAGFAMLRTSGAGDPDMCNVIFRIIDRSGNDMVEIEELAEYIFSVMKLRSLQDAS